MSQRLLTVILLLVYLLLFGAVSEVLASALPRLSSEVSRSIDIQTKDVFYAYFRYGNPTATTVTPDLSVTLKLEGEGIVIVPDQMFDLYYPTKDEQAIPQIPVCDNSFSGFAYPIDPKLLQNGRTLVYGPRTANVLLQPSGSDVGLLPPRSAGCLRIGLKVSPQAQIGQTATLVFDPDSRQSAPNLSPGRQTLQLTIGDGKPCEPEQEAVLGQCRDKCKQNQVRTKEGVCVDWSKVCQKDWELFDGKCVPVCPLGKSRNAAGACVIVSSNILALVGQIWTVPLFLAIIIVLWFAAKPIYRKLRYLGRK